MVISKAKLLCMFAYLFLLNLYCNCLIKIPFNHKPKNLNNITEFLTDLADYNIYSQIPIGDPKQKINFSITLHKDTTYLNNDPTSFYIAYTSTNSKSFSYCNSDKKEQEYIFQDFEKGYDIKETMYLEKSINNNDIIPAKDLRLVLATKMGKYSNKYEGQIGLLAPNVGSENQYNLICQLKQKGLIKSNVYTIKYEDNYKGQIIIGEYPNEYDGRYSFKDLIISPPLERISSHYWHTRMSQIFLGEEVVLRNQDLELSLGLSIIILNQKFQKEINEDFFNFYFKNQKCEIIKTTNKIDMYVCEKDIDITKFRAIAFRSNEFGLNFELTAEDLFTEYNNKLIFLVGFSSTSSLKLGTPFFKKYQLVFNQDTLEIGYYKYVSDVDLIKKSKIDKTVSIVIIIIILFLILAVGYKTYKYKIRKKMINTIENEDTYGFVETNYKGIQTSKRPFWKKLFG